eukprot:CAMPEP_0115674824 /NCGR_PEP_ID=MMETSP0272-20121206/53824_1 /TAXON_ID=71861 /ORGANISM="Scrippsiella trochoidea, Strain CCMP3099" /LENGTH=507 /DNA_ID=CAMNT_0003113753 /DNA_START=60 /DNA_END=1583 /DNA_ORIENTATION=+
MMLPNYGVAHSCGSQSYGYMDGFSSGAGFSGEADLHQSIASINLAPHSLTVEDCDLLSQVLAPILAQYSPYQEYYSHNHAWQQGHVPASGSDLGAEVGDGGGRRGKRKKRISEEVAKRLQSSLKSATYGTSLAKLFKKYDGDKSGFLTAQELKRLIRKEFRIAQAVLSDADIDALVHALDDDGTQSLSIDELVDFIERGTATFFSVNPEGPAQEPQEDTGSTQQLWTGTKPPRRAADKAVASAANRSGSKRGIPRGQRGNRDDANREASVPSKNGKPKLKRSEGSEGTDIVEASGGMDTVDGDTALRDEEKGENDTDAAGDAKDDADAEEEELADEAPDRLPGAKQCAKSLRRGSARRPPAASGDRQEPIPEDTGALLFLPLGTGFIQTLKHTPRRAEDSRTRLPTPRSARGGPIVSTQLRGGVLGLSPPPSAAATEGMSRKSSIAELCYDTPAITPWLSMPSRSIDARASSARQHKSTRVGSARRRVQGGLVLGASTALPGLMSSF